jgi:hypothetical protein
MAVDKVWLFGDFWIGFDWGGIIVILFPENSNFGAFLELFGAFLELSRNN